MGHKNATGFAGRVEVLDRAGGTCLVMPVTTPGIASFQASFLSLPDFQSGEGLVRDLAVSMLDKGTASRSRLELAEALDGLGASLHFSTDGIRIRISGRALRRDLPNVFAILSEVLQSPSFPETEFDLLKKRYEAAFLRGLSNTSLAASGALSRRLYDPRHPNFTPEPRHELGLLETIGLDDIRSYFERALHPMDLRLALVGDVDPGDLSGLEPLLDRERSSVNGAVPTWKRTAYAVDREEIHIDDRENIDVRIGQSLDVSNVDPTYLPLYIGNYVLGGNFSARLMTVIRDELGLTYGIRSALSDVDVLHHGIWSISVTLAHENLERGISETLRQAREFVSGGVSDSELREKKTTITGSFKVGLSSTGAIAGALLRNAEKGRLPEYFDRFPALVDALTVDRVNETISENFDPDQLHVALAGSLRNK